MVEKHIWLICESRDLIEKKARLGKLRGSQRFSIWQSYIIPKNERRKQLLK
jgi:hypothetical protein